MRRWMNAEEKRFVLWGFKEEWSSSRIAQALGVNEATVRRFRAKFVKAPNTLFDLNVGETIENPTGVAFRCLVCAATIEGLDDFDRHVIAHFLSGADLEAAAALRLESRFQHDQPMFRPSQEAVTRAGESEIDKQQLTFLEQHQPVYEAAPDNGGDPVVPGDADRTEMLRALQRLAALPDNSRSNVTPAPSQADSDISDNDLPQEPPDELNDVGTNDIHNAFERLAERRGLIGDAPSDIQIGQQGDDDFQPVTEKPALDAPQQESAHLEDDLVWESVSPATSVESATTKVTPASNDEVEQADGPTHPRPGAAKLFDQASRWVRTAGQELRKRDVFDGFGSMKEATSVTVESGAMKILSTQGLNVVDYRVVPLSQRLYAGGVVVDAGTISRHLMAALADMKGTHRRLYAAVPGYQSSMRRLDLPDARELDPNVVVPREARRALGVTAENSTLRWQRLPGRSRIARWLIAAASDTSYSGISTLIQGTGHKLRALELRPSALTRAVGQRSVLCICSSPDGCDVVVVRDWVPHTYQSAYWEADSVVDTADLVQRVTELIENTIDLHNLHNPEAGLPIDVPLVVTGGEVERHTNLGALVASNIGRTLVEVSYPLNAPDDFPDHSMVVNVGLSLWDA